MTRTFRHTFDPPTLDPIGKPDVELTVREIEDAGLREVLQTPGAPFSSWAILGSLLAPGDPFVFREPLGQAREVKVALSGLFGRFVARAYLERYFGLSLFVSLGRKPVVLDGRRAITIQRRANGDLPDWVASAASPGNLTIAEAKGSHHSSGPELALGRAWAQTRRVDLLSNGRRVPVKRIAVATRWGMQTGGPYAPCISVRDPLDKGDPIEPNELGMILVGLYRHHVANMIMRLGHAELGNALRGLAGAVNDHDWRRAFERANDLLDAASTESPAPPPGPAETPDLIGGVVTRAGPVVGVAISRAEQAALARLDLRPVYVGIHREVVRALIEGDPALVEQALVMDKLAGEPPSRSDRAGGWIISLDDTSDP